MKRITKIEKVGSDYRFDIGERFETFKPTNKYWCESVYIDGDLLFNLFNSLNVGKLELKRDNLMDVEERYEISRVNSSYESAKLVESLSNFIEYVSVFKDE